MTRGSALMFVAAALLTLLGLGCSEKEEPSSAGGDPVPQWLKSAPEAVQALDLGEVCGSEVPARIGGGGPNLEGRRCIRQVASNGERGVFSTAIATVEGDPVVEIWLVRDDGGVTLLRDTTEDSFAARRGWALMTCLQLREGRPAACAAETPLTDSTPLEFIDRMPVPSCGVVAVRAGRALPLSSERVCFALAARRGRPAELRVRWVGGEEGPATSYLRSLGSGQIEIFEDATRGGTGPKAWYLTRCEGLDVSNARGRQCSQRLAL